MSADVLAESAARPAGHAGRRRLWWIAAAFLAIQVCIISAAASGPFVDEGLYTVAGLRVLEGEGLSDGYLTWFNGSPFVWPVIAALGHHLAGLPGARLMAAVLSTVTLLACAKAAENLFGRSVSDWCAVALGSNGLFLALAHFAVYDVAALTGVALAMWCLTRASDTASSRWVVGAAAAFAAAVITKYGYMALVVPLLGLIVAVRPPGARLRAAALFVAVSGLSVAAYFLLCFGSLVPPSADAYLDQAFGRSRGHIAVLHAVFGLVPFALASAGAAVAWRRGQRALTGTCLVALFVFPAFHLWTANFVSGQKHVVAGFLFASLLGGLALQRLWTTRSRASAFAVLAFLALWGGLQCYWQDASWSDTRPLARYLASHVRPGDRVVAESPWAYTVYLYPAGLVESPVDVIDAQYSRDLDRREICQVPWVVGNPEGAEMVRHAVEHCRHQPVLLATTRQYYVDTSRLRVGVSSVTVGVYASRAALSRAR